MSVAQVEQALKPQSGVNPFDQFYDFAQTLLAGDVTIKLVGGQGHANIEVGSGGTATITGQGGGDDVYVWHQKNVVFNGNGGTDSVHFSAFRGSTPTPANGLTVDLSDVSGTNGTNPYGGTLTLRNVENVTGTSKNDVIRGNASDNKLGGLFLNGAIEGIGGNDSIRGEGGNDLVGFIPLAGNHIVLADGGTETDTLQVDIGFQAAGTRHVLDLNTPANNTGVFKSASVSNFEVYQVYDTFFRFDQPQASFEFRGKSTGEIVTAGWGDDTLTGNGGNDALTGLDGIDTLNGGAGNDTLDNKSSSKDLFQGKHDPGADHLDGGADTDLAVVWRIDDTAGITINIADPNVTQKLADGTTIVRCERLDFYGGSGTDIAIGGAFADTLGGNQGNDILVGGAGADRMIGDQGNDIFVVDNPGDKIVEGPGLAFGKDKVLSSVTYTLADNVEDLTLIGAGSIGGTGNALPNTIGGNGKLNVLNGGLGNDILKGGAGKDTFFFNTKPASTNLDHIKDFKAVDDTIKLENSGAGLFAKLAKGTVHDDAFDTVTSKSAVVDSHVRIVYDKAHGALYYDPNGGTASGRVQFAVLDNHATLSEADFLVV